jgi:pyruvate formate lyase activating enzyme
MRCDYCYNKDIVLAEDGSYNLHDVINFLKKRVGLLDGVVLSGGEATNHDLVELCKEIKELGYKIKLDTNGTNVKNLKQLCELNLIDYIALDYKAPSYKYKDITKSAKFNEFSLSLQYLISNNIDFEVRTTLHSDLLNEEDINFIIKELKSRGYSNSYYIQEFMDTGKTIGNIGTPTKKIDKSKLLNDLDVIFR